MHTGTAPQDIAELTLLGARHICFQHPVYAICSESTAAWEAKHEGATSRFPLSSEPIYLDKLAVGTRRFLLVAVWLESSKVGIKDNLLKGFFVALLYHLQFLFFPAARSVLVLWNYTSTWCLSLLFFFPFHFSQWFNSLLYPHSFSLLLISSFFLLFFILSTTFSRHWSCNCFTVV